MSAPRIHVPLILIAGALLLQPAPATAQNALGDLLGGRGAPVTLRLDQLTPEWQRVQIKGPEAAGGAANPMMGMLGGMMGMFGINPSAFSAMDRSTLYYTKGAVVQVGPETFLVAYQPSAAPMDLARVMAADEPPAPEVLKATSPLQLTLVNVRSISTLTDVRSFNLQRELAESRAAAEAAKKFGDSMKPKVDIDGGVQEEVKKAPAPAPARPARPRARPQL